MIRDTKLLDLVVTTNPTIVTHSTPVLGISDHDIIVTDFDVKIQYQNKQRRQIYQFVRADWESFNNDFNTLSNNIKTQYNRCTHRIIVFNLQEYANLLTNIPRQN